jgi:hypothetical protein
LWCSGSSSIVVKSFHLPLNFVNDFDHGVVDVAVAAVFVFDLAAAVVVAVVVADVLAFAAAVVVVAIIIT